MIAKQQNFADQVVDLDGGSFTACRFERCEIHISGILPIYLEEPQFVDCTWQFTGPASNTITFMTAMHRAGAGALVEKICADIMAGNEPVMPPTPPAPEPPKTPEKMTTAPEEPKKKRPTLTAKLMGKKRG